MSNSTASSGDAKRRMREVIRASTGVPERDLRSVDELVDAGELQVALENLCTQLFEYDVAPDVQTLRMIRELAGELQVDPRYWLPLDSAE